MLHQDTVVLARDIPAKRVQTSTSRPKRGAARIICYALAAWAVAGLSIVSFSPQPAHAASCQNLQAVAKTQTFYCGLGTYIYSYTGSTVYSSARTVCYNFRLTAFMCSLTSSYDGGAYQRCATY